jgi:selenophosphate synthase
MTIDTPSESTEPLTERELAIIAFEANWFTLDEDRHLAIRARFACSVEEYNLELNRVIDHPEALVADPLVVRRLRRQRERRRRQLIDGTAAGEQG